MVILNHNGGPFLDRCLSSVLATRFSNFEVILVDNGSTDGSVDHVRDTFRSCNKLKILETGRNLGASTGRNIGAKFAKGKYLAFLDCDTEVDGSWLKEAVGLMEQCPTVGAVQCKLLLMSDHSKIDYAGDFISQFGFLVQRLPLGAEDNGVMQETALIFGVKSAGMVTRRKIFEKIGMFDEDFFIYMEETDLCWRIWLSGSQVAYVPRSIVYHAFGQTFKLLSPRTKFLAKYHGTKNYITTILKNAGSSSLVRIISIHLLCWIGIMLWHFGRKRVTEGTWILSAIIYNLQNFRSIWRKRMITQHLVRMVADKAIMPHVMVRISPAYLYWKATHRGSGWNL